MVRPEPLVPAGLFPLDPDIDFLNHGSFGSCPVEVLAVRERLGRRLERQPVQFLVRELEGELEAARATLARFLGADASGLAFVANATTGVNTVLSSLEPELAASPGCELVVTDHEYNACRNALDAVAVRSGARVVVAELPFPCESDGQAVEALLAKVGERTRLVLIDHVTSQTGMVLPVERIVAELEARGVEVLVDGAHAPGMVALDLGALGATYYTGNCHKWMCAPKVAGFLAVAPHRRESIRPLVISHGANAPLGARSRFEVEFGWQGTIDPTAFLSVPAAIEVMGSVLPGGWRELMEANRALALEARDRLCAALGIAPPCPDSMVGSMAAVPICDAPAGQPPPRNPLYLDPLQDELLARHRIEVPIVPWPGFPRRVLRVSAQAYNSTPQYARLAAALEQHVASGHPEGRRAH